MGAPNIQQQLYLKTALNESKDGMFDHPTDLEEGYHMKSIRLARAGKHAAATLASDKAEASEMRRGGASKRTMKAHFNKGDYAAGTRAQERFDKAARKKKRKWLRAVSIKATGIAEALEQKLDEGYQAKRMRVLRKDKPLSPEVSDFMKRSFKKKRARQERLSGSKSVVKAMEVSARKKTAAMKEKGLAEGSLGLKSVLRKGKHNPLKYGTHMTKNAVRQLVARGRDPQGIKIYGTKGIENSVFQVNANLKKEKALKAKGIPNTPESLASRVKKALKRVNRMSR